MPHQAVLDQAAGNDCTLFTSPAGYLLTESLAAVLTESGRPVLWLRLDHEDQDPATFLVSLISAAQRLCPHVGQATLERMHRHPGPTSGWPPLFAQLGHELAASLPADTALVLEHCHHLNHTHPTLGLLGAHVLPALPASFTCVLTAWHDVPYGALPPQAARRGVNDLRVDLRAAQELADHAGVLLPAACLKRMVALTDGRAVALAGICEAGAVLGAKLVQQAVERANHMHDLLARIARAWLVTADAGDMQALALAARLEYSQPALIETALGHARLVAGPWFQDLADGWVRMRATWQEPLRMALRAGATPGADAVRRTADHLASHGALERAVPLYFDLGDTASAARAMTAAADMLMDRGQWELLGTWLARLPAPALRASPRLVYTGGEMAAAQGDTAAAQRAFALAAGLFTSAHDAEGACQSMLAESTLAAWQGNRAHAQARALAASAVAEAAGLLWHQGWAAWHLGCLAAAADKLDDALAYFDRAAMATDAVGDPIMAELVHLTGDLALRQRDLRRQREFHRQAYFATEHAEHEIAERLRQVFTTPPASLDALLDAYGWSRTPLMLKMPAPAPPALPETTDRAGFWNTLLSSMGLRWRTKTQAPTAALADTPPPPDTPLPGVGALPSGDTPLPVFRPAVIAEQPAGAEATPAGPVQESPAAPVLTAHLLGEFRVMVDDRPIEHWPSGRGRTIFKYLLAHRTHPLPRDVLMDVFWPEAMPESARNSLNVALHGLRQALRAVTGVAVVVFQDGAYRLNPELQVWLDVDEFERNVEAGRRLESDGELAAAAARYEVAASLYQGDFLADDPYEDWSVLPREKLRVAYLDTLDRLSHLYFSQGQYAACAGLCQRILASDNCREDAHCRLMRCYARQGQHHLALRQYQSCVEILRNELDIEPSPATTQLYERIRHRERV